MKHLMVIDIGNTNIVTGVFKGNALIARRCVPTKDFKNLLYKGKVEAVIVCSVVPEVLKNIKKYVKKNISGNMYILGENIKAPIKNLYKKPKQVGQDRLANGVAVYSLYGGGIAVDFGTAVTFDVISRRNEYLGGIIFPGIRLSLENLSLRAALLPEIKLKPVSSLLGRDTVSSMRSGILNGYGALCDGIIYKLKGKYSRGLPVIATGGDAHILYKYCRSIDKIDPNLTLKGLLITYKKNT